MIAAALKSTTFKKAIHAELARARAWQATYATNSPSSLIPPFTRANSVNTNYNGTKSFNDVAMAVIRNIQG